MIEKLSFSLDRKIILFSIPIMFVIVLKICAIFFIPDRPEGFKACYRSIINKLPQGQCEFNFDYFLKFNRDFTRYDETIDFDSDWKLGFWNELRFNVYQWIDGNQLRERNPFEVTWRGNILIPPDPEVKLSITYTGEGKIWLGKIIFFLPANYQTKKRVLVNINETLSRDHIRQNREWILPVKIYYRFQDHSQVGMDKSSLGLNSNICVKLVTKTGKTTYLRSYYAGNFKLRGLSMLLDSLLILIILIIFISHLRFLCRENKFLFAVYLIGGAVILFNMKSQPVIDFVNSWLKIQAFFFAVVVVNYLAKKNKRILYFFISFLFLTQLFVHINADLSKILYRSPGNDPMTYESLSRSMGQAENIADFFRGGEDVFYWAPFFRYYLAFTHIVLGDSNNSVALFNEFLFLFTIPFIFLFFSQRLKFIPALIFSLGFMSILYNFTFYYVRFGLSEYPAWLFLIIAVCLLFHNRSRSLQFIGFALLGFASITRINFLPGIFYLIFVFFISCLLKNCRYKFWQNKNRFILTSLLIFIGIYSLVPVHNLIFGNKVILTTSSAFIAENLELRPSELLKVFSDKNIRREVLKRLEIIFFLSRDSFFDKKLYQPQKGYILSSFVCLLMISFLFNIGRLGKEILTHNQRIRMKREALTDIFFIFIPLPFLFVHLFYQIEVYYPRHVIAGHMMIYLFSVYSASGLINWSNRKFKQIFSIFKAKVIERKSRCS